MKTTNPKTYLDPRVPIMGAYNQNHSLNIYQIYSGCFRTYKYEEQIFFIDDLNRLFTSPRVVNLNVETASFRRQFEEVDVIYFLHHEYYPAGWLSELADELHPPTGIAKKRLSNRENYIRNTLKKLSKNNKDIRKVGRVW